MCGRTLIGNKIQHGVPGPVVADKSVIGVEGGVDAVGRAADALLTEDPHEELQADEGEHAQTEHGKDHHVGQLLHWLDQSTNDGLQTWRRHLVVKYTSSYTPKMIL